jgi:hypothetical protein
MVARTGIEPVNGIFGVSAQNLSKRPIYRLDLAVLDFRLVARRDSVVTSVVLAFVGTANGPVWVESAS